MIQMGKQLIFVMLILCSGGVQAGEWIVDADTACKVWNEAPQPKETIKWTGPCVNGMAHGQGVLQWYLDGQPNERGEGQWQDGKANGYAVYVFKDGTRYEGEWRDNRESGYGIRTSPKGLRMEGEWQKGRMNGYGLVVYANGVQYEGYLQNGMFNGFGTQTVPRKAYTPRYRAVFVGEWVGDDYVVRGLYRNSRGYLSCSHKEACESKQQNFVIAEIAFAIIGLLLVAFGCYRNRHVFTFAGVLCFPYAGLIYLWSIGVVSQIVSGFLLGMGGR